MFPRGDILMHPPQRQQENPKKAGKRPPASTWGKVLLGVAYMVGRTGNSQPVDPVMCAGCRGNNSKSTLSAKARPGSQGCASQKMSNCTSPDGPQAKSTTVHSLQPHLRTDALPYFLRGQRKYDPSRCLVTVYQKVTNRASKLSHGPSVLL